MVIRSHYPVVIVGAGPVGVTAATLLAQYGVESLILDRWAGVYPQPRAVHLDDEVYRILGRIGIGEQFAAISRPALGLRLLDPDLRELAEFRRDPSLSRHGYPQANMFDQPELEALLRSSLERHPMARLRMNSEVTDLGGLGDGRTRITFTDRADGSEHSLECDYLLGCDGANSLVRKHIGARMRDLRFEQRWLVVDVDSSVDLGQWDGVHQVCDPNRGGTFMRVGRSRYRWEFRLLPGESSEDFGSLAALRPLIAPWLGSVTDDRLLLIRVAEYTFRAQLADRWRRGNVFLLGDAAHLTPPFIGQGLCAGLRDAMNLSWKLAGVISGNLPAEALDTYQAERKPHVRQLILLALTVGQVMTAGGRFGTALRGFFAPRLRLVPGLAARLLDSRTPALSRSALVRSGRRGPGLRGSRLAGTLCPNAVTATGERLDDVLGSGFALITTVPVTQEQKEAIEKRHVTIHFAPPGTELAGWLHRDGARAAIVRPDFTVMSAGRDHAALCATLPRFG
ncbi:bifunctional 3-(3-hydroxy-phenyl)propionate/3-hydroxycinnamic acid hydroxylase [Mycolicibacterium sp.]|uniref:bifunctional 3-(3-hydroxy-phenyl)propionate/3-hydroxycinnamic acid hydroxylase MhpA n=1 Tax=Mycolicibacterium sp. TaxID=2320850 RepID=UPI001D691546|nr:bifunctional 3-(3-hydroxy-phenyl)propionate/3-hydroxycinnamic acid hydroxylase [Mycolicibacterium sp.]MCB1290734.1 bifunctional 3-(3-hydroxy-phenyl)propionate/3-hydroxycinnamic acid hydroxylase [Mycobacterium sp.]MCB9410260.1 bifunctional 3-(3-hydroxy-phenyl)propionate/3-hydroxycinnamic acid hydroxylase [Mycolicibacterium sp.]